MWDNLADQQVQKWRSRPFRDVDAGESRQLNHTFTAHVPKGYGAVCLAISLMESDDESSSARDESLDEFAAKAEADTASFLAEFADAIGKSVWVGWKLEKVEVFAFRRGAESECALVCDATPNTWIGGGKTLALPFLPSAQQKWHQYAIPGDLW